METFKCDIYNYTKLCSRHYKFIFLYKKNIMQISLSLFSYHKETNQKLHEEK